MPRRFAPAEPPQPLLTGLRPFLGETLEVQPSGQTPKFVDLILEVEMEETS